MEIQSYDNRCKIELLMLFLALLSAFNMNAQERKKTITPDTINNSIYFVGVFQMDSMKLIEDKKTGYCFISDCSLKSLEKISSKDSKYLLRTGWNLVMWPGEYFFLSRKLTLDERFIMALSQYSIEVSGDNKKIMKPKLKNYQLYELIPQPSCYFLFMVKGKYFNDTITRSCCDCMYDHELKFPDEDLFYPIIAPAYPNPILKDQKLLKMVDLPEY